jgi:hypothetical protein
LRAFDDAISIAVCRWKEKILLQGSGAGQEWTERYNFHSEFFGLQIRPGEAERSISRD